MWYLVLNMRVHWNGYQAVEHVFVLMGSKRTTFLALDDSSLLAVLNCQRELGYLDILRISRCCKRLHALCQAELLWKSQYQAVYGHAENHAGVCFRQFFKDR